ncbi:hypothetical protein RhiTH_011687, partial [Rhizoctonia solani]
DGVVGGYPNSISSVSSPSESGGEYFHNWTHGMLQKSNSLVSMLSDPVEPDNFTVVNSNLDAVTEQVQKRPTTPKAVALCLQSLTQLARLADTIFERRKNVRYLGITISCEALAVSLLQDDHPMLLGLLKNLTLSYETQFKILRITESINNAILFCNRAFSLASSKKLDLFQLLNKLGDLHSHRFSCLREPMDIDRTIEYYGKGLSLLNDGHPLMFDRLNRLGMAYKIAFQRLGGLEQINKAVEYLTKAMPLITREHPNRPLILSNLGSSLRLRFEVTDSLDDLLEAIQCHVQATAMIPDGHPMKAALINNLGSSYLSQFKRLGELKALDQAVNNFNQSLLLAPENHPSTSRFLLNLSEALRIRFKENRGMIDDIDLGIKHLTRAVKIVPEDDPEMADLLSNLGLSYLARFDIFDNIENLNCAIQYQTKGLSISPKDHPDIVRFLSNLGSSYKRRFERLGILDDLNQAIQYQEQATGLMESSHPHSYQSLNNLGTAYRSRYEYCGDIRDLDMAIKHLFGAVLGTPDGHPTKPELLSNLGVAYRSRFVHLDNLEDIDQSIRYNSEALCFTPKRHPDRAKMLSNAGSAHLTRFGRLCKLEDASKAIELFTLATLLVADDHPDMPFLIGNLGSSHKARFGLHGHSEDINSAIECLKEGLFYVPGDHPQLSFVLETLGDAYSTRFVYFGKLEDIDNAIGYQYRATTVLPQNHIATPRLFSSLGESYSSRFERLRQPDDIEKAIHFLSKAMSLTPNNHRDRPMHIGSLGTAYHVRYQVLERLEDIDSAIGYQAEAALLYPLDHPHRPAILSSLGISYRSRSIRLKTQADIEEAIKYQSEAVALDSARNHNNASRPGRLANLSISYQIRSGYNIDTEDGNKSIELLAEAVSLLPEYHIDLPRLLNSLGHAYLTQSTPTNTSCIPNASKCFERSARLSFGYPRPRFDAARNWARIASESSDINFNPLEAYQRAMHLVPQIVWLGSTIEQRYSDVGPIGELAVEAAATAIHYRQYHLALEWLEQGRSVVWNQILKLRNPLSDLSSIDSALADRLTLIASELHAIGSRAYKDSFDGPSEYEHSLEEVAQRHRRLAEEYDSLINQAQQMPGFQNLLQPKEASVLMEAAQDGPVVVVNVYKSRCDALLILPDESKLTHVALPSLSYIKVAAAQTRMDSLLQSHGVRQRGMSRRPWQEEHEDTAQSIRFAQILEDLWMWLVEPVIKALAGCYITPGPKLFELAISSYTPNLASLLYSIPEQDIVQPKLLLVGQSATPGQSLLPGTGKELHHIRKHAQAKLVYTQLEGPAATTEAVLTAMNEHEWLHLACHAHQNIDNPTESGLFLQDGILDIRRISQKAFINKQLAFLSACQTATGDKILADETVHMASGLLMAGYPTVIATMWSVMDADAPLVADKFYEVLLKDPELNHRGAATALHTSVKTLRETVGQEQFVQWLPYVHFGT